MYSGKYFRVLDNYRAGAVACLTTGLGTRSVGRTAVQYSLLMALGGDVRGYGAAAK